ncbi:MAG: SGNH/GDSL hydrolase family protein [Verrucomicrobiales bacterium]|nr:SGNH/GDSL hydrolase family protein [Verrucomicrobiales bacterium]
MKPLSLFLALSLLVSLPFTSRAGDLPANARVAVIGDSITEQKLYSKFIECYLLACTGREDLIVFQFGWSGERADGFANRLANDLAVFHPTVATTCYGMNDGSYQPYNDGIGGAYEKNMTRVIEGLKAAGISTIAVGSPGGVDPDFFTRLDGKVYNETLAKLRDIAKGLAEKNGLPFANVYDTMMSALPKSKEANGKEYAPFGGDGFHPAPAGQLLMAQAFLKALGMDGAIGTITVDAKGATASEGHRVISSADGTIELESSRWPFCFDADPKNPGSTRSILPFTNFNEELNRLTLVVKDLSKAKAKVTWGTQSKEFTKEQLEAGINLAAEFSATPFDEPFMKLMEAVATKQQFETTAIKNLVTNFRLFGEDAKSDAELAAAFETVRKKVGEKHAAHHASARKRIQPVKHKLKVEPMD